MDKTIGIQHRIRNNAQSIRDYLEDLGKWEDDISQLDTSLSSKKFEFTPKTETVPPPRAEVLPEPHLTDKKTLPRDGTSIKDYYKSWDKFDVDSELEKIDQEENPQIPGQMRKPVKLAPPRSRMNIKGGRSANSDQERLKDSGNLAFTSHQYQEAISIYKKCLGTDPNDSLKVILYSNQAECYLRLKNSDKAEESASMALEVDPKHVKSYLRRAKAKVLQKKLNSATEDLNTALAIEPDNSVLKSELTRIGKKRESWKQRILKDMQTQSRLPRYEFKTVTVQDINAPVQEEEKKEKKVKSDMIQDAKKKAVLNFKLEEMSTPQSLSELQRYWAMFSEVPSKLIEYVTNLNYEHVDKLFEKASVESDFLMKIVKLAKEDLDISTGARLLRSVARNPKLSLTVKFLTKKEKEILRGALERVGYSQDLSSVFHL